MFGQLIVTIPVTDWYFVLTKKGHHHWVPCDAVGDGGAVSPDSALLAQWLNLEADDKVVKVQYLRGRAGAGVLRQAPTFQMHDFVTVSRVTMMAANWKTGDTVAEALQQLK